MRPTSLVGSSQRFMNGDSFSLGKETFVADALSRKERDQPLRSLSLNVRGMLLENAKDPEKVRNGKSWNRVRMELYASMAGVGYHVMAT
ncbi:hypothetical protein Tco_1164505 [Tanacetum coccineum]